MAAADSGVAFLPFLKKKPLAAAPKKDEEEDPLALPLPPASKQPLSAGKKTAQFVSKLNTGKAKPPAAARAPGSTQAAAAAAGKAAAGPGRPPPAAGAPPGKAAKASPGQPLSAAAAAAKAKADADAKRLRQLERMAKLGVLATADAPPELRQKVEQAQREAQAIHHQQQQEARRREALERQRQQREAELQKQRQLKEALQQRLQAEKQRAHEAKLKALHGPGYVPQQRSTAAASNGQQRQAAPRQPSADSSVDQFLMLDVQQRPHQQQQQQQPQRGASPYAHLNPRQRAFLEARQRERQGRGSGARGAAYAGARPERGRFEEGYESADSLDDFIDDGDEEDWRSHLREVTRYDPSKFKDFGDDRSMEASAAEIAKEEARSKRIGRTEDEREAEAEARRLAAKEAKRRKKSAGPGAFFDEY